MAQINEFGNITARCLGCDGALSSFLWTQGDGGAIQVPDRRYDHFRIQYRLYSCAACRIGALAVIRVFPQKAAQFPGNVEELLAFFPTAGPHIPIPTRVPDDIAQEYAEAERCLNKPSCNRAAAALFRSVLEKALAANGYEQGSLAARIDEAAAEGIFTASRQRRAHDEIRVLGNDILHDDWRKVSEEEVLLAHGYTQRVLEDLYDDRPTVEEMLVELGRLKPAPPEAPSI